MTIEVFHGTKADSISSILRRGLVPMRKKNHGESGDWVYVDLSERTAREWGRHANPFNIAVLRLEVPENLLRRDAKALSKTSCMAESIPAKYIKGWNLYRLNARTGDLEFVGSFERPDRKPFSEKICCETGFTRITQDASPSDERPATVRQDGPVPSTPLMG